MKPKLLTSLLAFTVLTTSVSADDIPLCNVPRGVKSVPLLSAAPGAIQRAVHETVGYLVRPEEPFDSTDVIVTGHNRRLIFIWNAGTRWVVATEQGGYVYNDPIFASELANDGRRAALVETAEAVPNTVCEIATSLIRH